MMSNQPQDNLRAMSVIGWGTPMHPRTFSGYSRALTCALEQRGLLRHQYSAKQVRWLDLPAGAIALRAAAGRLQFEVRRAWMWSERGSRTLQRRLSRRIRQAKDSGPFLQFGTLVELDRDLGKHYLLTDMTIRQAHRAGWFAVGKLDEAAIDEAVRVQSRVLHSAAHIFTLTDWARQSIIDDYGVDPARITAVYIGSNLQIPPDLVVQKKPHQVLFVGIDWERKGGPQLVEGFRRLLQRLPTAELVIVGCSPKVSCPNVRVLGFLPPAKAENRQQILRLYLESGCFAMLSDFEPLGNVFIEAYSAGLPIIAYDRGSRREIIEHGQSGILCRDREPETVADALYAVLHDEAQRQRMSRAARARADHDFNWNRVIDRMAPAMRNGQLTSRLISAHT